MAIDVKIYQKRIRLLSVYLPHAGYTWKEFEDIFNEITALAMEAQDRGIHLIIAGDFNLCIQTRDRGRTMRELCHQFRLNSSEEGQSSQTSWTFRSRLGPLRTIDYILYSEGLNLLGGDASSEIDLGSDHRCVRASFEYM